MPASSAAAYAAQDPAALSDKCPPCAVCGFAVQINGPLAAYHTHIACGDDLDLTPIEAPSVKAAAALLRARPEVQALNVKQHEGSTAVTVQVMPAPETPEIWSRLNQYRARWQPAVWRAIGAAANVLTDQTAVPVDIDTSGVSLRVNHKTGVISYSSEGQTTLIPPDFTWIVPLGGIRHGYVMTAADGRAISRHLVPMVTDPRPAPPENYVAYGQAGPRKLTSVLLNCVECPGAYYYVDVYGEYGSAAVRRLGGAIVEHHPSEYPHPVIKLRAGAVRTTKRIVWHFDFTLIGWCDGYQTIPVAHEDLQVPEFGAVVDQLFELGYHPVPEINVTRIPARKGYLKPRRPEVWRRAVVDRWQQEQLFTGILTDNVAALDVDVLDPVMADALEGLAADLLGQTLKRIGLEPKRLLVYRTDAPLKTCALAFRLPGDDQDHLIEILGAGRKFTGLALHSKTLKPYAWPAGSLLDVERARLPAITADGAAGFLAAARELIAKRGGKVKRRSTSTKAHPEARSTAKLPLETVAAALRRVPNDDRPYGDWVMVCYALKWDLGVEVGAPLFDWWSSLSSKYDAARTAKLWWEGSAPDGQVTSRTILWLAHHGWQK